MIGSPQFGGPLDSGHRQPAWTPRRVQRPPDMSGCQRFVLLWFSEGRGWMPAGVASRKTGPVASDIARFARQHTKVAQKEPRIQWVRGLDPDWTPMWTPGSSGVSTKENGESRFPTHSPHHTLQVARICCMCRTQKCCNTLESFRHSDARRSWSRPACACAMPSCGRRQARR